MNITNGSLFRIIKTLNKQEQTGFINKLKHSQPNSSTSHYTRLFTHLLTLENYHESTVKKQLQKYIPLRTFPVVKKNLREKLLRYLIGSSKESDRKKLHLMLIEVELLFNRQLYFEAEVLCNKVIHLAQQSAIDHFFIEANGWLLLLQPHVTQSNYAQKVKAITTHSQHCLKNLELGLSLREFMEHVLADTLQSSNTRSKKTELQMLQLLQHPLMKLPGNLSWLNAGNRMMLEISKMQIYRMLGKIEDAYNAQKIVMKLLLKNWKLYIKTKRADCLSILCNHFAIVCLTNHFNDFTKHLSFVHSLLQKEFKNNTRLFLNYTLNKFLFEILTKREKINRNTYNQFETFYFKERSKMDIGMRTAFSMVYGFANYEIAQYQKAVDTFQYEINEYRRNQIREDQLVDFQASLVAFSFLHIISKRWTISQVNEFECLVNSLYHSFRKKPKDEDYRVELCLIKLFRSLQFDTTKSALLKQVIKTEKELQVIFQSPSPDMIITEVTFKHQKYIQRCKHYLT